MYVGIAKQNGEHPESMPEYVFWENFIDDGRKTPFKEEEKASEHNEALLKRVYDLFFPNPYWNFTVCIGEVNLLLPADLNCCTFFIDDGSDPKAEEKTFAKRRTAEVKDFIVAHSK